MTKKNEISILSKCKNLLADYRTEKDLRDKDYMNLFSSISDAYKKENYNSDILRFILDPNAMGEHYLREFLRFIELKDSETNTFMSNCKNNIEVTREENKIDILIKNKKTKQAIIIESKVNGACDQPMQLIRYYKKISEEGIKVKKVVYLTVYPQRPDLSYEKDNKFSIKEEEYKKLKEKVEQVLFKTFISSGKTNREYHRLQDYLKSPKLKSDIVKQYKKLIDKLGGEIPMKERKAIRDIFSDPEKLKDAKIFFELWENRGNDLIDIFYKTFPQNLNSQKNWKEKNGDKIFYHDVNENNNIELFYYAQTSSENILEVQIGFHAKTKTAFKGKVTALEKILKDLYQNKEISLEHDYNNYYYITYPYEEDEIIGNYFGKVAGLINKLQKESKTL